MDLREQKITTRMRTIRLKNKCSQADVAIAMDTSTSGYNRIETGMTALSYEHLLKFANFFKMSPLDVITYPKKYREVANTDNEKEVLVMVKLKEELKDQVLTDILGNSNLELLNK